MTAAIKLLSIAVATTAISASPINPLLDQSTISRNHRRLITDNTTPRQLQNGDGSSSSYTYLDDLTGYSLQYSHCIRAKIPNENDDDGGNANFYDGAYRAQYNIYATFHVCGDGSASDQCAACDYDVEYAAEIGTFLETGLEFWENYCEACNNNCRRKLDEGGADVEVNCNTCASECNAWNNNGDDNDESAYLECQAAYEEDGNQLYYGPQCIDGQIVIGLFYDEECTIKTKYTNENLSYNKFDTVTSGCIDCSNEQGAESCDALYRDSFHCLNGNDQTGRDNEMNACAAVKKALMNVDYSGVKKRHSGADTFLKVFFVLLILGLVGGFFFLSYTYYIRHTGERTSSLLSSDDVHVPETPPGATLT